MVAYTRWITLAVLDFFQITLSLYLAVIIKYGAEIPNHTNEERFIIWLSLVTIGLICNTFFNLYRSLWHYTSINEILYLLTSGFMTVALFFMFMTFLNFEISLSVYFMVFILNTVFLCGSRLGYRVLRRMYKMLGR